MTTQWKSRRLAARAVKVLDRHKGSVPAIAAFEAPLGTAARSFITGYDASWSYNARWRVEMQQGRGSVAALAKELELWKPHVARERPGFDLSRIADRPAVPEDLIEDALALADELREIRGSDGEVAPWAATAAASILEKAAVAERETDEAAAADAEYSSLLRTTREAHAVFDAELGRFRSTLRAALGSSHPDYQKLRDRRAGTRDVDDDPNGPPPSDPVDPAPAPPSA